MPILRLRKHQANFSDEDILINQADFPSLKLLDVVELRPPKGVASTATQNLSSGGDRILLQVRRWPETNQSYPNTVSIKDSVVNTHLKLYADVLVNVVDKKEVIVDSIEICFSNAYLARSYMWGLRNYLNNRCVYQRQKLDYLHIRSQISEIWAHGNKVTSGYFDDDTKIVFRSASSLVYLFIQMSSEMWDYDINGDLYCEKAINGFLTDLIETWRRNDCSHDITIILFSRTFYDAGSLEEFPEEMRECLQVDYRGIFYEDCYRVAMQNDRFDLHDWNVKLTTLKSLFNQYQKEVINRHQGKYATKIPRAYNSSAAQGNFLEVLNMSLNVFEKHYFDRSFDRTGQLSVVVSPGVGVFEVDFELTNLTKQRIIDNGIGSDLVCLGEQPLHTVPLLKFNSKSSQSDDNLATCDVYNMPHWINLSFYSSQNQVYYSNFVPRIKLPTLNSNKLRSDSSKTIIAHATGQRSRQNSSNMTTDEQTSNNNGNSNRSSTAVDATGNQLLVQQQQINPPRRDRTSKHDTSDQISQPTAIPDLVDYDDYDAQVFKSSPMAAYQQTSRGVGGGGLTGGNCSVVSTGGLERSILADMDPNVDYMTDDDDEEDFLDNRDARNKSANVQRRSSDVKNYQEYSRNIKRQASENLPINQARNGVQHNQTFGHHPVQSTFTRMSLVDSYLTDVKIKPESADDLSVRGYNVQSSRLCRSSARPKALINPFDPSHMTIKLTPNRRRWTHVFTQGPTGTFIQQHHYQPLPQKSALPYLADVSPPAVISEAREPALLKQRCQSAAFASSAYRNNDNLSMARMSIYNAKLASHNNTNKLQAQATNNKTTLVSNDTIRFAWCASGEQEWTPAITTGVDWKSLTMPACLPLTTDFFPSKTSLQNDYVISEYNIDSSFIHSRYTLIEVYRELVCQRLQKGFQIILLPGQQTTTMPITTNTTISSSSNSSTSNKKQTASLSASANHGRMYHQNHHGYHHSQAHHFSNHQLGARSSTGGRTSGGQLQLTTVQDVERERTEYTLSIGRIFHKLTLNGNTITVTHYRPRHPYPTIKIDYCYRFRAPFHESYIQSWVHFKSEKLENYNWNYLDNYICARGESTFALRSSLKFWRFRILILPSKLSLSKMHQDQEQDSAAAPSASSTLSSSKVNGIGKETNSPKSMGLFDTAETSGKTFALASSSTTTRHDIYYQEYSDDERDALMESFIKLLEIINKTRRASACRASTSSFRLPSTSSSGVSISSTGFEIPSSVPPSMPANCCGQSKECWGQNLISPTRLLVQIGDTQPEQMLNNGSNEASLDLEADASDFVSSGNELKFESMNMDIDSALRDVKRAEWVHVQYHNFFDIYQGFELIIKWMVASGAGIAEMVQSWSRKMGNSSVHVVPVPWEPFAMPHSGKADPLRCPLVMELQLSHLPNSSCLNDNQVLALQEHILRLFGFTRFHDLISTDDIERQYVHLSGFAFVALPNLIGNAVGEEVNASSSENQKAATHSPQQTVVASNQQQMEGRPIQGKKKQLASDKLDVIVDEKRAKGDLSKAEATEKSQPLRPRLAAASLKLVHQETISSPHEEYITRHIGGARQNKANRLRGENERIEFIWSWNYMLTKRWRSPSTQDESYAVSLMRDFKAFCQNDQDRLLNFWNEIKSRVL